jgi:hypothetical protein
MAAEKAEYFAVVWGWRWRSLDLDVSDLDDALVPGQIIPPPRLPGFGGDSACWQS